MTNERLEKLKRLFDDHGPIVKAALLRENKFCSKDIAELIAKGYLKRIKTGYYVW